MLVIYLNIDEVIQIIRNEDDPKKVLQKKFKLSLIQVDAILEIRLRQLAKLEEIKITEEQGNLDSERKDLEKILSSKARLKTLIKSELNADLDIYGDDERFNEGFQQYAMKIDPNGFCILKEGLQLHTLCPSYTYNIDSDSADYSASDISYENGEMIFYVQSRHRQRVQEIAGGTNT